MPEYQALMGQIHQDGDAAEKGRHEVEAEKEQRLAAAKMELEAYEKALGVYLNYLRT